MFGFPDDAGFHSWRLTALRLEGADLAVDVAGAFGRNRETIRLIPRTPAAELTAEVELARLKKANEIGRMIADGHADARLERVALNTSNGRMAQIIFSRGKSHFGAIGDVTAAMTPEAIMTSAMLWYERLGKRKKKPVLDIWIVAEKRQARNLQKLHALLSDRWRAIVTIFEISRKADPAEIVELPKRQIRDLWREKSRPLTLPDDPQPSSIARELIAASPENIDIVYSKQGETRAILRPAVRPRQDDDGQGKGVVRHREGKTAADRPTDGLGQPLLAELELNRTPEPPNKRHELYRTAPESGSNRSSAAISSCSTPI